MRPGGLQVNSDSIFIAKGRRGCFGFFREGRRARPPESPGRGQKKIAKIACRIEVVIV